MAIGHRSRTVWLGYHELCALASGIFASRLELEQATNPRVQVGFLPSPRGGFFLADAQAIKVGNFRPVPLISIPTGFGNGYKKTVMGLRQKFPKPVYAYEVLNFYGNNIVTTEFHEWKRHRKIVAPAFGEVRGYPSSGGSFRAATDDP